MMRDHVGWCLNVIQIGPGTSSMEPVIKPVVQMGALVMGQQGHFCFSKYRAAPCRAGLQSVPHRESERAGMAQDCPGLPRWSRLHRSRGTPKGKRERGTLERKRKRERDASTLGAGSRFFPSGRTGGQADRRTGGAICWVLPFIRVPHF